MINILSRISLFCHILILLPFLFPKLPAWYPQWSMTSAFIVAVLAGIASLALALLNSRKKIYSDRTTTIAISVTLALSAAELTWLFSIIKGLAEFH